MWFSSWWSWSCCASEPLVKFTTNCAICIAIACNMYLLWLFSRLFIAKRWIVVSNLKCSYVDKNLLVLDRRRLQFSRVGVALWMFVSNFLKRSWVSSIPLWYKIIFKIIIVVNSIHWHFPGVRPTYIGFSITGGSWPKLVKIIIHRLSNE